MQVTHLYSPCSSSEQESKTPADGQVGQGTDEEPKTECKANCVAGPSRQQEALPAEKEKLLQPLPSTPEDKWKPYFEKFDVDGKGNISMEAFQVILYKHGLKDELDPHKLEVLEATIEDNTGGRLSYQEFVNIMSDKRTLSFSIAVRTRGEHYDTESTLQLTAVKPPYRERFLKLVADEVLTNEEHRRNFLSNFLWCLPPLVMLSVSCIELGFYIGIGVNMTRTDAVNTTLADFWTGPVPKSSWMIFDPEKKIQFWRFATYIFVHGGIEHLLFNLAVQLLLGVAMEMVHGSRRIGGLYISAIAAGSMGSSVLDRTSFVCGASAGTYALLSAHLANVLLNFSEMKIGALRFGVILALVSLDFGLAVYRRYSGLKTATSFIAHLMGIAIGLTIGLFIVRNYDQRLHERLTLWVLTVLYMAFVMFVIFWNIFYKPAV
ncbi:rhomboid-related protein 3-like isoform X1 [Patiria miniata]|uniref:EF-hand domain-containing protein n=1 Tax=Patiria miniata TaxID=46514 RepID=A0A913Z6C4_PATMI|nr:rhomboid-related protein 3-like isoform X1 [Patiria miniata]XP_038047265.1 rhomboid-related protein 3-like isoform X1 [Patiria miniata]